MKGFIVWTVLCLVLFGLTLCGILLAQQSTIQNNIQDVKINILQNNVTYLTVLEEIISTNITSLDLRLSNVNSSITIMWNDLTVVNQDIQSLYNFTNATFLMLLEIHSNLTDIDIILQQQYANLTILWNQTIILNNAVYEANNTLTSIINLILQKINTVTVVNHNIDLVTQCGVIVYPSMTPDTIDIDVSSIQTSIDALTIDLNATIFELFKQIILSNTTIAQVNYQYPLFGNIVLESGNEGVAIDPHPNISNAIRISNTAIGAINNVSASNVDIVGDFGVSVTNDGPSSIFVNNTVQCVQQISSPVGLEVTYVTPRHVTVENVFAKRTWNNDNTSYTCYGSFNPTSQITTTINIPVNFFSTSTITKLCKYAPTVSSGINLNDVNATYLIELSWASPTRRYISSDNGWNMKEEYWYCIGILNCAGTIGESANWRVIRNTIIRNSYGNPVTYPVQYTPMAQNYVITYQTGTSIPPTGNYISIGWRWTACYSCSSPVVRFDQGYTGQVLVQRIG